MHTSSFPLSLHAMSLYIDMKIILTVNCSGSHCISVIIFWISARICNVVNRGNIVHSNSIGSPSIRSNSRRWGGFIKPTNFLLPCAYGTIKISSHAQCRIGEYVDFRCWQLNCSVVQQRCPFPRFVLPIDQGYSMNFCLFGDQLPGTFEQLFVKSPHNHCQTELRLAGWPT